jgi:Uma2 family endonuclease
MARTPSAKYTYEDYVHLADDGRRKEIIDGELYVTPSPVTKHQAVSRNLEFLLLLYLRHHPIGVLYDAPCDVIFSDADIVQPDIIYVSNERAGIITDKNIRGAPDLLVEILSESYRRNDEVIKRDLYERHSVDEYWIVDPVLETIKVYRREGSAFQRVAELSNGTGDALSTPLLPELRIPLSEIFTAR